MRAALVSIALVLACDHPLFAPKVTAQATASPDPSVREAPLKIVYQRSGGFAGLRDRLEITGDSLSLTRRNKSTLQRKLTADEQASLRELEQAALATPAPGQVGAPGADTMQITVTLGDAATPQLTAIGHNLPPAGLPPAWDALVQKLKALLDRAIAGN